ncbi:MAG: nucleotidyl transferase AbiEii/AbiGii toxin family protein, partial [Candidatus Omnitrophica bacterium]|nr:nucleotidyl transferase AbiEii/AbiGii toxin family protein [Candidatus Omnitrophota bacterium]
MKKDKITGYQQTVLKALAGKIENFYLAGGTALSLFYFQHRLSVDLDFFTPQFNPLEVKRVIGVLQNVLNREIKLVGQTLKKDMVKIMVYNAYFTKTEILKIDFVEDIVKLVKNPRIVDGVKVLSLEDIYIRKIHALTGFIKDVDEAGQMKFAGGRSDAKDFYDVYFLSHTFLPLSKFTNKYCDATIVESLIRWFRTFDRMDMIDGLLSLA